MAGDDTDRNDKPIEQSSSLPQNSGKDASERDSGDKKVGWIESLAQRSTGLPGTSRAVPRAEKEKSPWRYAGIGLQFGGTTLLFLWMGYALDKRTGWSPWGTVTLAMLGLVGSMYLLIKDVIKENADRPQGPDAKKK